MPHTFELSMQLSGWQHYNLIVSQLYTYTEKHRLNCCYPINGWQKGDMTATGVEFKGFVNKGITMYVKEYSSPRFKNFTWEFKINPMSLYGIDRISVAGENDVQKCLAVLDFLLWYELGIPHSYTDFNIKRVDCAYNYDFRNAIIAKLYMSLLKKGCIPDIFVVYNEYSAIAHRKIEPKDSIYCRNGSVTINIYIKTAQLERDRFIDENYNLDSSIGIIRFEVQCNRNKLVGSKKRMKVNNLSPEPFLTDNFNFDTLDSYMKKFFRTGDYYTYAYTKNIIENSRRSDESKELMLTMLELTSKRNGLKNAKNEMLAMSCYTNDDIKATLRRFDELRINPVTIPATYKIDYLPSPTNLLAEHSKC